MGQRNELKFHRLAGLYGVVRLAQDAAVPDWATTGDFTSITRTDEELSIVCPTDNIPPDVQFSNRWVCLKLDDPFPLSQTGVLLSFIEPLSENGVPIFTVSTYDTDYVLIEEDRTDFALSLLRQVGHKLIAN